MPETSRKKKKKPNGTGRKRIEIKKIEKNSSRKVAFSKRRKGLFKKGAELCRLCDAMIAIVVFSPKGRVYTFGDPSPDYVIDHFLAEDDSESDPFPRETDDEEEDYCVMEEENSDKETNEDDGLDELEKSISEKEAENSEDNSEKEVEIDNDDDDGSGGGGEEGFLWEESIEDFNMEELEKYKICMEMLRYNVGTMVEEVMLRRTSERDLLGVGFFSR